jgi:aminopeptidase
MNTENNLFPRELSEQVSRYARLIATHGLNVRPGQLVQVSAEPYHRAFLRVLVPELYRQGAALVHVDLTDPYLQRARILHSPPEHLSYTPRFYTERFNELVDTSAATLKILGPEEPDYLSDLDPQAVNQIRKATYQAAKRFYAEGIEKSRVHWCAVAAPTARWAARIFPSLEPARAELALWTEILRICRVDRPDYLEQWHRHNELLTRRAERLTSLAIRELHFTGPGTDLHVGLSDRAVFRGGAAHGPYGVPFEPNIPTEEVFTTPDWRQTRGIVRASRPFLVNGRLIRGLSMVFENGELQSLDCEDGKATLDAYLSSDKGAKRLGEVALVGIDSPVYQSGLVFEEILFDENAACHIALGTAYRACLENGEALSDRECEDLGCNSSSVHTDIMISSSEVDVDAILRDESRVKLIEKGRWIGAFV